MRKTTIFLLILLVLVNSCPVMAIENSFTLDSKNEIATIKEFAIWKNANLNYDVDLYSLDGNDIFKLYSIINENGVIGYMISDPSTNKIIEFSLGESPYENFIDRDDIKQLFSGEKGNPKLIYSLSSYSYTNDNFETNIDINQSVHANTDVSSAVKKSVISDSDLNTRALWKNVIKINGVEYNLAMSPTPGCGPVSGINIVKYWDNHGYPNLFLSTDTNQMVYDSLYDLMGSFPIPFTNQVATDPYRYTGGLKNYFQNNGNYYVSITFDQTISISDYNILKTEVNNNRPGTILYGIFGEYDMHYVTFTGYCQNLNDEDYYIIHDLHHTYDVYRAWSYDVSTDDYIIGVYWIHPS